jgi:hypothetical protein
MVVEHGDHGEHAARAGLPGLALVLVACLLVVVAAGARPADARHREPRPRPWTDWRPTRRVKPNSDLRVRQYFWWPTPCYLDLAPVVFPDPPPPIRPLFARALAAEQLAVHAATIAAPGLVWAAAGARFLAGEVERAQRTAIGPAGGPGGRATE